MSSEFVIQPNRSLSDQGRWFVFSAVALVMGLITLRFLLLGGWMVAPFMLADMVALIIAFKLTARKCEIIERVLVRKGKLTILHEEKNRPKRWSFSLHWVKVELRPGPHPAHGSRLLIGSHGEWIELAGFLRNDERESLARAIRRAVVQAR